MFGNLTRLALAYGLRKPTRQHGTADLDDLMSGYARLMRILNASRCCRRSKRAVSSRPFCPMGEPPRPVCDMLDGALAFVNR